MVKDHFYEYGFYKFSPDEGLIELKKSNTQKFIIYGNDMSTKQGLCNIYLLKANVYQQLLNLSMINFYDDRFEVDCIFNEKGKYKIRIYGNKVRDQSNNMQIL